MDLLLDKCQNEKSIKIYQKVILLTMSVNIKTAACMLVNLFPFLAVEIGLPRSTSTLWSWGSAVKPQSAQISDTGIRGRYASSPQAHCDLHSFVLLVRLYRCLESFPTCQESCYSFLGCTCTHFQLYIFVVLLDRMHFK